MTVPATEFSDIGNTDPGSGGVIGGGGTTADPGTTPAAAPIPAPASPPEPGSGSIQPGIIASAAAAGRSVALLQIPLVAAPSQVTAVLLGTQQCRTAVYQKRTGLFLDLFVNDRAVALGVICRDRVWLIRDPYLGFVGDLAFVDLQGASDPDYTGLANRFQLVWGS